MFEPPPSFRASGGVCRSRACQLNICSTIYKTPYNIFVRGTPNGVSFALRRKKFINVEFLICCIKKVIDFYAVYRNSVHFVDFRSD